MNKLTTAVLLLAVFAFPAYAAVQKETVTYSDGDVELKGYLYWDDAITGKRPGILVVHEWWGLNDYAMMRAEMLAKMGYIAFAADMYGAGKITTHAPEAKGWMQQITANVEAWQRRANLALEQLKAHDKVDAEQLGAIGYCFGGATVMQMVYAGSELDGVVSFHGSLPPASPDQAAKVKAKVLIAHGDADNFIPADRITAFKKALSDAGVDWEMNVYANAVHGFTNPDAASYGVNGVAYQEAADKRSWQRMQTFFKDLFPAR